MYSLGDKPFLIPWLFGEFMNNWIFTPRPLAWLNWSPSPLFKGIYVATSWGMWMNVHLQARSLDFNFSILFGQAVHTLRIHCSLLEHNSGSKAGQYSRESEHNLGIIRDLFSQQSLIEGICLLRQRHFWSTKTLLKDERYFNMRISEVVNKLSCKTKAKREGKIWKFIYMHIDTKLRNIFKMISISFFSGHNLHRQLSGQKHKRWKWRGCIDRYNKVNSGQGVPKKVTNRMPLEPWWTRSITKTCYWQS